MCVNNRRYSVGLIMKQLPGLAKRILGAGQLVPKFDSGRHCQLVRCICFYDAFWSNHSRKARSSITSHLYPGSLNLETSVGRV